MNPKARKFARNACVVCGYPFSDAHHTFPAARGGKDTIILCPNHHRAANMIQIIVEHCLQSGDGFDEAVEFARENFDIAFNAIVPELISAHCDEEKRVIDRSSERS